MPCWTVLDGGGWQQIGFNMLRVFIQHHPDHLGQNTPCDMLDSESSNFHRPKFFAAPLACESKKYFSGVKRPYINSTICYGYSDVWSRNHRHSMSQLSISEWDLSTANARRWGEKHIMLCSTLVLALRARSRAIASFTCSSIFEKKKRI